MPSREDRVATFFMIAGGLLLMATIFLGLMWLLGPRGELDAERAQTQEDVAGDPRAPDLLESPGLDTLGLGLDLIRYELDQDARVVEGTAINTTDLPYVRVEVEFEILDIDSAVVTTVRDTLRELRPQETWDFRLSFPEVEDAAYARHTEFAGHQRTEVGLPRDQPPRGSGEMPPDTP